MHSHRKETSKKYKLKQALVTIYAILVFLGLFLGPSSWYFTDSFVSEYNAFAKGASEAPGRVHKRWKKLHGRSSTCYITVMYNKSPFDMTLASRVKVLHALEVKKGDKVTVLYRNDRAESDVRIKGETDWKNLPPIQKPYAGVVYTLFSYLSLLFFIIRGRRLKRV